MFIAPKNSGLEKCREIAGNLNAEKTEFIRGEDVPSFVERLLEKGKKAIGITGEDLFSEFRASNPKSKLNIIEKIKWNESSAIFGKPALCLLGPSGKYLGELPKNLRVCVNRKYSTISNIFLSGLSFASGINFENFYFSGSTENAFRSGLCDLVIDIVYSGKSAKEAGLEIYSKIMESDIVVIGGKNG